MKYFNRLFLFSTLLFSTLLFCSSSLSQISGKILIKGLVTDALTGDPIPYVSVILKSTTVGTLTDKAGNYKIETNIPATVIQFSFIGYQTETRNIITGAEQTINIGLKLTSISLDEIVVKPRWKGYKNKNNPAVELIQNVIARKDSNMLEVYNFLEYKKYEKIQFAISNLSEKFIEKNSSGKFSFVFNNIDTTKRVGNDILPVFIKESISSLYFRKYPEASKEIILAEKTINLDEYLNNKGVSEYLDHLYQNINIYDNEILFLTNKFLSPIAETAPIFYKYFIIDTLPVGDTRCIRLFFEPRNETDFLFHGNLYITMDTTYVIRKIDIGINKNINIDWIKDIIITQDFERVGQKAWLPSKEEISIDFGVVKNTMGLYGQRTIYYKDYKINEPLKDDIFRGPDKIEKTDSLSGDKDYWESNRFAPLTKSEKGIYSTVDSLERLPAFRRRMELVMLLTSGYLKLGKIEIGPSSSLYSFNSVEGTRFRTGGRTSIDFSKKITLEGYVAYGLNDKIFKYNAGITYSLTPRTIFEFPVKSIKVSYLKDARVLGQDLQLVQSDNIFLSVKRGVDDKYVMNNTFKVEFLNEFENHFSYLSGYSFTRQATAGNLYFNPDVYGVSTNKIDFINISEFFVNLRYAPNESFYQGKVWRTYYPNQYPVIQMKIAGGSGIIDNDFDYLRLQMNISRRYYISIFGYADVSVEAGKIFGRVPYPLLFIHRGNQTYSYLKSSYNLMNFLEFVSDRYISFNIDHSFNGFILNKIPLMKKLKLRELVTCKVLFGKLSESNNPDYRDGLFKFPVDSYGIPLTYSLDKKPYIEAGVGLSNILKIIRVDFIRRFTYTGNPHVTEMGIRFQFKFDI